MMKLMGVAKEGNYLGVDWGRAKVGLALAHEETRLPLSLQVLKNDEYLLPNLEDIIRKENIGVVIIGQPKFPAFRATPSSGTEGEAGKAVFSYKELGDRLSLITDVAVEYIDEMFSTKIAQGRLKETGEKRRNDDAEAARILLEDWLESRQS